MPRRPSRSILIPLGLLGGLVALVVAATVNAPVGVLAGLALAFLATVAVVWLMRRGVPADPSRRRFLAALGLGGFVWVLGGAAIGSALRRLFGPRAAMDEMASGVGAEYMDLVLRQHRPGRSGDLQLVLAPFNSSNYGNESRSLAPRDPRTSHATVWMYLERVPLAVYAPGIVGPSDSVERVSLADIAPTIAHLMGFEDVLKLGREGRPLPGIPRPATPPKVIVTFVIDGGGWNVLSHWDTRPGVGSAWPTLKRVLGQSATFRNAIQGSFPAVTACAHATIGTGAYPRTHGITGHNIRVGETVRKAYGTPGTAMPGDILVPTLADLWSEATSNRTWIGELGYQVWHLGMIGAGGPNRTGDQRPVAVYWNELATPQHWAPHNPDLFRLPNEVPDLGVFARRQGAYQNPGIDSQYGPFGIQVDCCSPPIVQYQGDLIESTLRSEPVGADGITDLLFINFKSPDYTGHIYNMLSMNEHIMLKAVDDELARLVGLLESRFAPGEFALIVTADHGQCPLPDAVGGTRVDPIQLDVDLQREFGEKGHMLVQYVAPSEVFIDHAVAEELRVDTEELAAFLKDYRYRDNLGPYVPRSAVEQALLNHKQFAAVFATSYLDTLAGTDLARFGKTAYPGADPGIPAIVW